MALSILRAAVCGATLFSCSLAGNIKVHANLRAGKEDPHDWHKDLGVEHHDKHDIDTKEGQDNASTPYHTVQDRVESDLVGRSDGNRTEYPCDTAPYDALRCGPAHPWSEHIPFRPKLDSWMDQCKACKIRACNSDLELPSGNTGCRCGFKAVKGGFNSDCVPASNISKEWKACGSVRTCDKHGAGGQCVHSCWEMPSAPTATNPNIKITDADKVSSSEVSMSEDTDKEDDVEKEVEKEKKEVREKMEKDDKKDKKDNKDKKDTKDKKGFWNKTKETVNDGLDAVTPDKKSGAATNSAAAALVAFLVMAARA